jgi:hypothetical protein
MNDLLLNIILLALISSPKWSVEYFDAFCDRIEPLISQEYISEDEVNAIMKEFDLVDTGTKCCIECANSAVQCAK